ncbi:MAG: DUF4142 domain-containing protein [Pseudomonadota bacterium]|nr:DUF4142 domain-containing protein [Pseudomonadota bacterium]
MKTGTVYLGALLVVALAGCNRDGAPTNAAEDAMTPPPATATPPDGVPPVGTVPDDGTGMAGMDAGQQEALALLAAVDEHEIAAAEQARSKNVDGAELEFAELMDTEHSKNLEATRALMVADAAESAAVAEQKSKGQAELERLGALDGDAYEDAYIDAMVAGHEDALNMLETRLIPAAQDEAVRQHLSMSRDHVAAHLEKARALQAD